ncbi:alpha-2-macroglobulin family protein [Desulfovibrio aerotolerans]|uniref:Alpha-2-macroglobulin family protein n=1 Tax=Solidesulfovibrio aerotolerans TaxID=295255 RepID=A0A7C9NJE5_9BACT|nr:alpha-2-macroglobulin [Solidesulfovibrio aerotolerans]MYL83196.1 alpha-2-macroglobulin family protein [Solidesulfovibrio aerotolerans]
MNQSPTDGTRQTWKNWLIAALAVIALGEFALLARQPAPPPAASSEPTGQVAPAPQAALDAVRVAGLAMDPERGRYLLAAFDRPVGAAKEGASPAADPAVIEPPIPGRWTWISPYMLRFEPKDGFAQATVYTVKFSSQALVAPPQVLAGQDSWQASYGSFEVARLTAHLEPAAAGGAMVVVRGEAAFNRSVEPKALVDHIKLVDPRDPLKPVAIALSTTHSAKKISFVSDPIEKTPQQRDVKVVITPGLLPDKGDIALAREAVAVIPVALDPHLRLREVKAASEEGTATIRLTMSTPVEANEETAGHIRIEPDMATELASDGAELLLSGAFEPGREYSVVLEKGLIAADGAVLDAEVTRTVRVPDLEPSVDFRDQGLFLSRNGYKNLAVKSVNATTAEVSIDRVYFNNMCPLFTMDYSAFEDFYGGGGINSSLGDRITSDRVPLRHKSNTVETTPLNLEKFIQGQEPGLYRVALTVPGKFEGFQRFVCITDIGIIAKQGPGDLLVWTASVASLAPLTGASVKVYSHQNQELAGGTTDAQGLFRAKINPKAASDKRPYLIVVQKGADTSFLLYDRFRVDEAGLDVGGAVIPAAGYTAFIYGERDIYRPGETLEGLAVVRDVRLGVPPSMPVTIRLADPQGRKISEQAVVTGAEGAVSLKQSLPSQSLTGAYTLEIAIGETVIGQYRFQVEEFVPDRISVAVTADPALAVPGQAVPFAVSGRYLFGAPGADLPVEVRARLVKAAFAPKGFEQYVFGDPERSFEDTEFFQESGALDAEGKAAFEAALPDGLSPPAALEAIFTARVREGGGRGVSSLARMPVHVYASYPGLKRLASDAAPPGKPLTFDCVSVASGGALANTAELSATLYRDAWQTVLRKGPDGSLKYESVRDPKVLDTKTVALAGGKGRVSFTPPSFGSYRVVLTDDASGAATQVDFYAGGFGYSPWAMENPARIELKPDKTEYASSETAKLQVRAPFGGKLLVAVEGSAIHDVQIIDLPGNTGEITVPIKPEYMPGVYVTATLVRKVGDVVSGSPSRAYGATPIGVDKASGKLPLTLAAPAEIRPGTTLSAEVSAPPGSVVTVAAVDEGILQLIAQKTPNPFAAFYAKRQLQVETSDTFALLLPEVAPILGKALAGGGDGLEDLSNFVRSQSPAAKTVAFWSGLVSVGPTGKATVHFDIPEFQGQVRLMAVGASGRRFASTEAKTIVKSPLVLLPSFPRFLSFGDKALTTLTVRNDTGKDGSFAVTLTASGPASVANSPQTVAIAKGATAAIVFPVTAGESEGVASLAATVSGGGESSTDSADIPVRSPLPARTSVRSGSLESANLTIPELASGEFLPGTARRDVTVGASPLIRFTGNLKALLGYPYGCLEQTTSKAFPLLYFADLARAMDPAAFENQNPAAMVLSGLRRITGMQLYNGGFAMWPGGDEPQPWMSLYATHFLVEAAAAGYPVDKDVLGQALRYAGETGREAKLDTADGQKLAAYALFVQAKAGRADIGAMDNLRDAHGKGMAAESKGLLAAAYAAVGNTRAADLLVAGPVPSGEARKETGGTLDSTLRDKALYLSALMDAAPADPRLGSLVVEVGRLLEGEAYPSTQENAFALLALGKFYARQQAKKPFSGQLFAGSGLLSDFSSAKVLSLRRLADTGDLRLSVTQGFEPGSCFYSVRTRGIPAPAAYAPHAAGLEIARTYLTRNGEPLLANTVPQGALVVVKFAVRATSGPVANVVLENLLPAGLEVENPRLDSTERLPWMGEDDKSRSNALDLRDDRILMFTDLPDTGWQVHYALLRAVTPGEFRLPPAQAEAMYAPELRASGEAGSFVVTGSGK